MASQLKWIVVGDKHRPGIQK